MRRLLLTLGIALALATPAQATVLPVDTKQPTTCEPKFFGANEPLRLAAIGATYTTDDEGAWYATTETVTYRRKQQWAAQFITHRDGRMIVSNIGTRPVRWRCEPNSSAAHAVPR
jgi:hypothetical protein